MAIVLLLVLVTFPTRAHGAGGAFAVEDAEVDAPGTCKVESWASRADSRDFVGVVAPGCNVDLGRPVELKAQFRRSRSDEEWGTELIPQAKANVLPAETGRLGMAVQAGTAFDLLTGANLGSFVIAPLTFQFHEQFRINLNAGWLYDRATDPTRSLNWFVWGANFVWSITKQTALVGEVFGLSGHRLEEELRTVSDPRMQAGLRFTPVEALEFDIIYGRNITGQNAHWITLALYLRFNPAEPRANGPKPRVVRK